MSDCTTRLICPNTPPTLRLRDQAFIAWLPQTGILCSLPPLWDMITGQTYPRTALNNDGTCPGLPNLRFQISKEEDRATFNVFETFGGGWEIVSFSSETAYYKAFSDKDASGV